MKSISSSAEDPDKVGKEDILGLDHNNEEDRLVHAISARELQEDEIAYKNILSDSRTFELLWSLHDEPTMDNVRELDSDLSKCVLVPFKSLFEEIKSLLPKEIASVLETENALFPEKPFHKNKWGYGKTSNDFYWGAFYPKGGHRDTHGRLFVWINYDRIEFGFSIGQYGSKVKDIFKRNFLQNHKALYQMLKEDNPLKVYYSSLDDPLSPVCCKKTDSFVSWSRWLKNPEDIPSYIVCSIKKNDVEKMSEEDLTDTIVECFQTLFPLILLSQSDDPMPKIGAYLFPSSEETIIASKFSITDCAHETKLDSTEIENFINIIKQKQNVVFYGPPGTGKTFLAKKLSRVLASESDGFIETIQFHPSYSYEDFIQGVRPVAKPGGMITYSVVPGRFLDVCSRAIKKNGPCILIIDEMNRCKLSLVFGELLYLLEYRDEDLPLSAGGTLRIPKNLIIIGTMNTADRSLDTLDHAMRRRFAFLFLKPNYEIIERFHTDGQINVSELVSVLKDINKQIGDEHYSVGVSFFLIADLENRIKVIWQTEIEPLLEELFIDYPETVDLYRWERLSSRIIDESKLLPQN